PVTSVSRPCFPVTVHLHSSLFFFSLLPPPPPRSTLFPYTTLFRSQCRAARPDRWRHADRLARAPVSRGLLVSQRAGHSAAADLSDRKSTRLNSSHVAISYAVFCLKKKKKKKKHQQHKQ